MKRIILSLLTIVFTIPASATLIPVTEKVRFRVGALSDITDSSWRRTAGKGALWQPKNYVAYTAEGKDLLWWFHIPIPDPVKRGAVLYLLATFPVMDVYSGTNRIHRFRQQDGYSFRRRVRWHWHAVPLPEEALSAGRVFLAVRGRLAFDLVLESAVLGRAPDNGSIVMRAVGRSFRENFFNTLLMILYGTVALLSLMVFLARFRHRHLTLLYFGLFMLSMAVQYFAFLPLIGYLLAPPVSLLHIMGSVSLTAEFALIGAFVSRYLSGRRRRFLDRFWKIRLLYPLIILIAGVIDYGWLSVNESQLLSPLVYIMIAEGTLMLILLDRERKKNPERSLLAAISRATTILLMGFLYSGFVYMRLLPYSREMMIIVDMGILGFLVMLAYSLLSHLGREEQALISMREEMRTANRIQSSLLPKQAPDVSGTRIGFLQIPMREVGGDLFDFVDGGPSRLGVLAADVSGHGVPAALIASMVKVNFPAALRENSAPEDILTGLNRRLCGQIESQFVTAGYLDIDLEKMEIVYASGAHPPLIIHRRTSDEILEINSKGGILGVFEEFAYGSSRTDIRSGDRLLIYTDGIIEAADRKGGEYGDIRLSAFIREHAETTPQEFCRILLEDVRAWGRDPEPQDDLTAVVVDIL